MRYKSNVVTRMQECEDMCNRVPECLGFNYSPFGGFNRGNCTGFPWCNEVCYIYKKKCKKAHNQDWDLYLKAAQGSIRVIGELPEKFSEMFVQSVSDATGCD